MTMTWQIPADPRLDAAVAATPGRIGCIDLDGQTFWVKRIDRPSLINRLQKGPARTIFDADLAAIKALAAQGVPVPQIVGEGPGVFVTRDSGLTLDHILRSQAGTVDERVAAFSAAGTALARLHRLGISHGRPVLRDLCWKNGQITFLDFENFRPHRNQPRHFRLDLIIFVLSCYAEKRDELPEIVAAKAAYRADDVAGIWQMASDWLRRMRWVDIVTKPVQWRADPHAREFKSIPVTLRAFAG
jgi:tRNA A-37 threonylcarbamoyl transferase component Bud32